MAKTQGPASSRHVLVPLDGSPFGERALPWARAAAGPAGRLQLLTVAATADRRLFYNTADYEEYLASQTAAGNEYLAGVVRRLGDRPGPVTPEIGNGRPATVVVENARTGGADLIVLTSHGRGAVSRLWLGSVADQVIRESEVPVLVVRPAEDDDKANVHSGPPVVAQSMIIMLDGSIEAEQALDAPRLLRLEPTARIVLLQVLTMPIATPSETGFGTPPAPESLDTDAVEAQKREATEYLGRLAARLVEGGHPNVVGEVRIGSSAASVALDLAHQLRCPLIALTTHGRGGVARLLMGSVADKIVRAGVPLTLVYGRHRD